MSPVRLPLDRVGDALRRLGRPAERPGPAPVQDFVVRLPAWVASYGVARLGDSWLLLVESSGGDQDVAEDGDVPAFSVSQAVLDLPEGRYSIEATNVGTGAVLSRESAASPPLVVGVPRRARRLVLSIVPRQSPATAGLHDPQP